MIGAGRSIVAENNYGYTLSAVAAGGDPIQPGLQRVDVDRDGRGCRTIWRSDERAPSIVPKLSLDAGLVYTYTLPPEHEDAWYLTALDFRTGETVYRRLAGGGAWATTTTMPRSRSRPMAPASWACSAA